MIKRIIIISLFSFLLTNTIFAARVDNNDEQFSEQPCFGLDNANPSGSNGIINNQKSITPIIDQNQNKGTYYQSEGNRSQVESVKGQTVKCRIHSVTFYTIIQSSNFVPMGQNDFLIKYHYTHDNQDYYLTYDQEEDLWRPYTEEEWKAKFESINKQINVK